MSKPTYEITDHLCRRCGGRVLQQVGGGPSGGGNPAFRCADCGARATGMGPECVCWCGYTHMGYAEQPYMCLAYDGNDHLDVAFSKNGFRMHHGEVGAIPTADFTRPNDGKET